MIGVTSRKTILISMALALAVALSLVLAASSGNRAEAYPAGWTSDTVIPPPDGLTIKEIDTASRHDVNGVDVTHVVGRCSDNQIYYWRSTDKGVTWEGPTRIDLGSGMDYIPTIEYGGAGRVYVAYATNDITTSVQIAVRRSWDYGATWEPGYAVNTNNPAVHFMQADLCNSPTLGIQIAYIWKPISSGTWEVTFRGIAEGPGPDYTPYFQAERGVSAGDGVPSTQPVIEANTSDDTWIVYTDDGTDLIGRRYAGGWDDFGGAGSYYPLESSFGNVYANIACRGGGRLSVVWGYGTGAGSYTVREKKVIGSSWQGTTDLYSSGSTVPWPKVSAPDAGADYKYISIKEGGQGIESLVGAGCPRTILNLDTMMGGHFGTSLSCSNPEYTVVAGVELDGEIRLKRTDIQPPECSCIKAGGKDSFPGGENLYFKDDFNLSFEGVLDDWNVTGHEYAPLLDFFTNGVSKITVTKGTSPSGPWADFAIVNNAPWSLTVDAADNQGGPYYFRGVLEDTAGNVSYYTSGQVVIDSDAPETTLTADGKEGDNGFYVSHPSVTITSSDPNVDKIEYRLTLNSNGVASGNWTTYTKPFTLTDGIWDIEHRATDKAGNVGVSITSMVKVDTIAPSCAIERPDRDFIEIGFEDDQEYRLTGSSIDSNGVARAAFRINGDEVYSTKTNFNMAYVWQLPTLEDAGTYEITVSATDMAGNAGSTSKNVVLDNFCKDWFFAEGNTLPGFDEFICLANPGDHAADVVIGFHLETGQVIVKNFSLPAHSRQTVVVKDHVPGGNHVSAHVHCDSQAIVAERPMYFNYRGKWAGGHNEKGINAPQKNWYFAEGTTRKNSSDGEFEEWICLQNPTEDTATVKITYMTGTGDNIIKHYQVGPHSRKTVDVYLDVGLDQDVSTMIESDIGICAERPQYFDYHQFAPGGHVVSGVVSPLTDWYFAEGSTRQGFQEWVTIQNPNTEPATIKLKYMTAGEDGSETGSVVETERVVPPRSRDTVEVAADVGSNRDVSIELASDVPVVAERPMYFVYREGAWTGGHDVMGVSRPATEHYLAEGTTRDGFDTWITLQNPNDWVTNVEVRFMYPDGNVTTETLYVNPHTRVTLCVDDLVDGQCDVATSIAAGSAIVVERPMYFDYHGLTGGHNVSGYGID